MIITLLKYYISTIYPFSEKDDKISRRNKHDAFEEKDEDVTDILSIPELEAGGEQDITKQVADAPRIRSSKIQSLHELDSSSGGLQNTFGNAIMSSSMHRNDSEVKTDETSQKALTTIDLSLLTRHLLPSDVVYEEDAVWDVSTLTDTLEQELFDEDQIENDHDNIISEGRVLV